MARLRRQLDASDSSVFWHTRVSPKKSRFGRPRTPVPFSESQLDALEANPEATTFISHNIFDDRRNSTLSTASCDKPLPPLPPVSPYLGAPVHSPWSHPSPESPAMNFISFPRKSNSRDFLSPRPSGSPRPMSPARPLSPTLSFIRFTRKSYGAIYKQLGTNIPFLNHSTMSLDDYGSSPHLGALRSGLGSEWSLVSCPELKCKHSSAEEGLTAAVSRNIPAHADVHDLHMEERGASPTMSSMDLWWSTDDDARSSLTTDTQAPSSLTPPLIAPSDTGTIFRKLPKALRPVVVLRRSRLRSSRGSVCNPSTLL
ncbi:hypothetical protein OBBRIDRAFT_840059 [Obba rivulosa]|uniref:Uncharacterized protein n=1 Tax=Obba rivulosa TaxID=1052685 RepID=A0A8E2AKH6_9APHY|nr:hypothetical protein OBBRIDRAFT_840059 [Obba rivulosa]